MQVDNLSWFPGHMTKTRRMITAEIKNMDAVCEILDARIPLSSRNPDVDELTAGKPRLVVLNRVDQADPGETRRWAAYFRGKGYAVLESNAKNGVGTAQFAAAVRELLKDKLQAYADKGQVGRVVRVMVLGIPNVGKSTFINKVAKRKTAKAEDRPGVTRSKQWVPVDSTLELLDTPGILWPKFDDERVGILLACTGAIKDDILDVVGDEATLGKPIGSDVRSDKTTFVALKGLADCRILVAELTDRAVEALAPFGSEAESLRGLAQSLAGREK